MLVALPQFRVKEPRLETGDDARDDVERGDVAEASDTKARAGSCALRSENAPGENASGENASGENASGDGNSQLLHTAVGATCELSFHICLARSQHTHQIYTGHRARE